MLPNSFDDKGSRIEYIYPNDIGGMGRGCTIFLKTTMAQEVNYPPCVAQGHTAHREIVVKPHIITHV